MERKQILLCGHRSFVATGLTDRMTRAGLTFDCFSRGEEKRQDNVVTGDVLHMADNPHLGTYDVVLNFILLKEQSVEANLAYIASLLQFCRTHGVKRLIQISSISVYPNTAEYVNETSPIEADYHNKGGYAGLKVAVDHYLTAHAPEGLHVTFVRPGYIYTKGREVSRAGILVSKCGVHILLGDQKTSLPLINREKLQDALLRIALLECPATVYLLLNKDRAQGTKYLFVRNQWNVKPLCLPRAPFMLAARLLRAVHLFREPHYLKVVGLFKRTWFDSSASESALGMNFGPRDFAILGAGTYGSYVANLLSLVYPHERITLYDVGDEHLKTESEMGFLSHSTNAPYEGLHKARFFGYGGASVKWGGQLLTFSEHDFAHPTEYMRDIVAIDRKYKDAVLRRFHLSNPYPEKRLDDHLFTKTGIWLSYFHRNLFKHFGIARNPKVRLVPHARVTELLSEGQRIVGFRYLQQQTEHVAVHDQYFLTAGAFESSRLLVRSHLSREEGRMSFSDHLSQRAFRVKSGPVMGGEDFTFLVQGASLVTKRFVGEVDGYSFYSQPINNENFPFFKDLKRLLYGHHISVGLLWDIVKNIPQCLAFAWYMLALKKLYVYKNEFELQIDIEAPRESGALTLSRDLDAFGQQGVDVNLSILPQTGALFTKARAYIKEYLDAHGVDYEELPFSTTAEKYEDVYHSFGMFSDFKNVSEYFHHFDNMLVVNTGVLPRAGGINSTCAVFPLVEEYVNCVME